MKQLSKHFGMGHQWRMHQGDLYDYFDDMIEFYSDSLASFQSSLWRVLENGTKNSIQKAFRKEEYIDNIGYFE